MPPPPPPPLCFPFSSRRSENSSMRSGSSYSDSASFSTMSSRGAVSRGGVTFTSSAAISIPQTVVDHKGNKAKPKFESVEKESKTSSREKPPTRSNSLKIFKTPFTRSKSQDSASYVSPASVKKWSVQDEIDEEDDPVTTVPSLAIVESRPRLIQLRSEMVKQKIDAYIIPSTDDHGSEYTALCDRRRLYISGFTGSSGTAVVLAGEAHMFVDSRYWVQAERELSEDWILHRVGDHGISNWDKWILETGVLKPGQKVGLDSRMITHEAAIQLSQRLNAANIQLAFPYRNLVDVIWKDRPVRPRDPIFVQPAEIAGTTAVVKLRNMRQWMDEQAKRNPTGTGPGSTPIAGALVASLDSIAWLLNLRGNDVPYNPLFLSYLFVSRSSTPKRTVLFTGLTKVNEEIRHYLDEIGVDVKEYNDVWQWLRRREWGDGKVLITPKTPYALSCMLTSIRYVVAADYIENTRAIKNDRELEGLESAYERDGSAMVRWLAWLDEKIRKGHEVDEHESGRRLTMFRKEVEGFMGLAYETISASGSNASMPHYVPSRAMPGIIDKNTPYLIDSGGQYIDGTCDTTRTMHFGRPTDEQREAYTRVLQGHIAIDTAVFPEGTNGMQLDVLARRALWKDGMNYHHGTGHGFGAFLTVHEGPHSFASTEVLRPGHVLTNEPGFYKEGDFGIRIESALYVVQVAPPRAEANSSWLAFRRFTCVPIQTKMIKPTLLTKEESQWVKTHNALCYKKIAPLIAHDKRAMRWLKRECERDFVPDEKVINIEW